MPKGRARGRRQTGWSCVALGGRERAWFVGCIGKKVICLLAVGEIAARGPPRHLHDVGHLRTAQSWAIKWVIGCVNSKSDLTQPKADSSAYLCYSLISRFPHISRRERWKYRDGRDALRFQLVIVHITTKFQDPAEKGDPRLGSLFNWSRDM